MKETSAKTQLSKRLCFPPFLCVPELQPSTPQDDHIEQNQSEAPEEVQYTKYHYKNKGHDIDQVDHKRLKEPKGKAGYDRVFKMQFCLLSDQQLHDQRHQKNKIIIINSVLD